MDRPIFIRNPLSRSDGPWIKGSKKKIKKKLRKHACSRCEFPRKSHLDHAVYSIFANTFKTTPFLQIELKIHYLFKLANFGVIISFFYKIDLASEPAQHKLFKQQLSKAP